MRDAAFSAPPISIFRRPARRRARYLTLLRVAAVPAALALLALVLVFAAVRGNARALDATVTVHYVADPSQIGATTEADVQVHNRESAAIRPRFSVSWLPYPYYWDVISGPATLAPGETATYRIRAPDTTAAPPDGQPFRIKVNDATSIVYAMSPSIDVPAPGLAIVNPGLHLWTQRDPATGLVSPAGWQIYAHRGADDKTSITEANVFGVHAARFHVVQAGHPDQGGWTHTGLIQEIPFPAAPIQFSVLSDAPYEMADGGWPLTAFGVEVSDSANGLLWLLFQPTGRGDLDYSLPSGHHIHVYDIPPASWQRVSVDLPAIYQRLHWAPPARVSVKLFIAAASAKANDIQGYIAGLTAGPARQP